MVKNAVWLNPWARLAYHLRPREEYKRMTEAQLEEMFTYHAPKGNQQERYQYLRKQAKRFAEAIIHLCPPSREQSIALTKIQEASMMANAAIAINEKETFPVIGVKFMGPENGEPLPDKVPVPSGDALGPAPERPVEPEAPEAVDPPTGPGPGPEDAGKESPPSQ